tara:strand:- start:349 stop:630 length:282 start_codon:yes stop_codon:yes gene_type:complete
MKIAASILEVIDAVRSSIDIVSLMYVILEAKLNFNNSVVDKNLNIRYEINKKNNEFCSNINTVNFSLKVNKSSKTENKYVKKIVIKLDLLIYN